MVYVTIVIFIIAIIFFTRFVAIKKEVRNMATQVRMYTSRKTDKKIDMSLFDHDLEQLGSELNKLIDLYVEEKQKRIRFEKEQKRTIANMSHDFRTPLTSIIGYIQMASKDDVSEQERKELLETARRRAKTLEKLLNDFFELSLIESSDYPFRSEKLNVTKVTVDVLMSFYDRFQEKGKEATIDITDEEIFIIADESAVIRVMENLLTNALIHSDGNIIIVLEADENIVRFVVTNDAYSLTEQDVERLFDRFFIGDASRSRESTGLGLSIAKSLMEKMNGNLSAQLQSGQLSVRCEWRRCL